MREAGVAGRHRRRGHRTTVPDPQAATRPDLPSRVRKHRSLTDTNNLSVKQEQPQCDETGQEFDFRQPRSLADVNRVLFAAWNDPYRDCGPDGELQAHLRCCLFWLEEGRSPTSSETLSNL